MVGSPAAFAAATDATGLSLKLIKRLEKSTCPSILPTGGMITSSTSEDTTLPNAAPIITPTAKSITFPRTTNSLQSLNIEFPLNPQSRGLGARKNPGIHRGCASCGIILGSTAEIRKEVLCEEELRSARSQGQSCAC